MSDQENMARLAKKGTTLVDDTIKYLSTLPHQIEMLEELIAVTSVTCTLVEVTTLSRFVTFRSDISKTFLMPLCNDIGEALRMLEEKIQQCRRLKVSEPNEVGLVRLPQCAWNLVMGGESRAQALRSRLYVEKYRVRVLVEAVAWHGLKHTAHSQELKQPEVEEFRSLNVFLPLIAERCIGVHRDYSPRLKRYGGGEEMKSIGSWENLKTEVAMGAFYSTRAVSNVATPSVQQNLEVLSALKTTEIPIKISKLGFNSCASTESVAHTCSSSPRSIPPFRPVSCFQAITCARANKIPVSRQSTVLF